MNSYSIEIVETFLITENGKLGAKVSMADKRQKIWRNEMEKVKKYSAPILYFLFCIDLPKLIRVREFANGNHLR